MSAYGFVYVLYNGYMPTVVKIGRTERSPHLRAAELSGATAVPSAFVVAGYVETSDCVALETAAHRYFARDRVSENREFFQVDAPVALDEVEGLAYSLDSFFSKWESDTCEWLRDRAANEEAARQRNNEELARQEERYTYLVGNHHDWSHDDIAWLETERAKAVDTGDEPDAAIASMAKAA